MPKIPKATKPKSTSRVSKPSKKKQSRASPPRLNVYATGSRSSKSPPPEPTTHKMLTDLLNWHPKTAVEKERGGRGTRPPAFFDMHLDDKLILQRVVCLPSMEQSLQDKVNGYLYSAEGNPIELPLDAGFPNRSRVRKTEEDAESKILSEADVQTLYLRTTATLLCGVASTLALKLPSWEKNSFFDWVITQSGNRGSAVGDGFLKIQAENDVPMEIPSTTFKTLQNIQKWFPNTAIWEFKNLNAGAEYHLQDIRRLALEDSRFPWIKCPGKRECLKHFDKNTGRAVVTGARMGPNAVDPVICLSANTNDATSVANAEAIREVDKRTREHTVHLLQQAWAEAVRQDATFVILQCGNFEMVLQRCRVTNTFFISDIIVVDRRGYGRTQVGLYLSIYEDVVSRVLKLSELFRTKNLPPSWLQTYKTKPASSSPKKRESLPQTLALQKVVEQKARSYTLALFNRKQDGYLPHGHLKEFERLLFESAELNTSDDGSFTDSKGQDNAKERKILFLDLEDSNQLSPFVFDAKLHTPVTKWNRPLVVKYAHKDSDYTKLLNEFAVYCRLIQEEGIKKFIPDVIGCFTFEESPKLRHATLVMKKCGISLAEHGGGVNIKDRISCIRILQAMHDAGYIHGNLNAKKILRDVDSSIRFIGLSSTVECDDLEVKEAEFDHLLDILNDLVEDHIQRLKDLEREGLGTSMVKGEIGPTYSILFGPIVNRNDDDLRPIMAKLMKWLDNWRPPLTGLKVTTVQTEFLHVSRLTESEVENFLSAWRANRPFESGIAPFHTFLDYPL